MLFWPHDKILPLIIAVQQRPLTKRCSAFSSHFTPICSHPLISITRYYYTISYSAPLNPPLYTAVLVLQALPQALAFKSSGFAVIVGYPAFLPSWPTLTEWLWTRRRFTFYSCLYSSAAFVLVFFRQNEKKSRRVQRGLDLITLAHPPRS